LLTHHSFRQLSCLSGAISGTVGCLAGLNNPNRRYPTYASLLADIELALQAARDAEEQRRLEEARALEKANKTTPPFVWIALATVVVILLGIGFASWQSRKERKLIESVDYPGPKRELHRPFIKAEIRNLEEASQALVKRDLPEALENLETAAKLIPATHSSMGWFRFFTADVFQNPGIVFGDQNVGFNGGDAQRRDVEQAMLAFDSDLAPIVGQQITLDDANLADVSARLALLEQRAGTAFVSAILGGLTTECDLVAHGKWNGRARSALYDPQTDSYVPDSLAESPIDAADMRTMAQVAGQATTFTCVPPGSGTRIALDRDQDGMFNFDETTSGTDPGSAGSVPGACSDGIDNDGDGAIDLADSGCPAASSNIENPQCSDGFDNDGDGLTDFGGDPDCTDAFSNRELALPTNDCRVGRANPAPAVLWLTIILLALRLGVRRRRRVAFSSPKTRRR